MAIRIIRKIISKKELKKLAIESFGDMVKVVVDVKREIMAIGGELHAEAEAILLENGSDQKDLWGINIYPDKPKNQRIEFTALINIRPSMGSRSMEINDKMTKNKIKKIIDKLIE